MLPEIPEQCVFTGYALIPKENGSQLTPWPIGLTVLVFNIIILLPTYKWNRFSLLSAAWSLISAIHSFVLVAIAQQGPMVVAHNMPFSAPLAIGSAVIRLTLDD